MRSVIIVLIFIGLIALGLYFKLERFDNIRNRVEPATELNLQLGDIRDGDIIFQISQSAQSKAIQLATNSRYSHCGIIYKEGDKYFVFEAIEPVSVTPLNSWIQRGEDKHYVIKRLKNATAILNPSVIKKMKNYGSRFRNKHYDSHFQWSDDRIYCSELIWKIYKASTGLQLGKLQKLRDFDLSSKAVKDKIKERYGSYVPLNEPVISPESIFNSHLLTTIESN